MVPSLTERVSVDYGKKNKLEFKARFTPLLSEVENASHFITSVWQVPFSLPAPVNVSNPFPSDCIPLSHIQPSTEVRCTYKSLFHYLRNTTNNLMYILDALERFFYTSIFPNTRESNIVFHIRPQVSKIFQSFSSHCLQVRYLKNTQVKHYLSRRFFLC